MERQYMLIEEHNFHKLLREPIIVKYFSEHKDEWIEEAKKEAESVVDVFYYMRYKLLNLYEKIIVPIGRKSFTKKLLNL